MISIHALREEGDEGYEGITPYQAEFLSTPSARRATKQREVICNAKGISIHALREEGDEGTAQDRQRLGEFLSTPSARRATLYILPHWAQFKQFLSTPSARRATSRLEGE